MREADASWAVFQSYTAPSLSYTAFSLGKQSRNGLVLSPLLQETLQLFSDSLHRLPRFGTQVRWLLA